MFVAVAMVVVTKSVIIAKTAANPPLSKIG
jgi:hypothetical protein